MTLRQAKEIESLLRERDKIEQILLNKDMSTYLGLHISSFGPFYFVDKLKDKILNVLQEELDNIDNKIKEI